MKLFANKAVVFGAICGVVFGAASAGAQEPARPVPPNSDCPPGSIDVGGSCQFLIMGQKILVEKARAYEFKAKIDAATQEYRAK